jgi:uncharacterized membrane protein YkvI
MREGRRSGFARYLLPGIVFQSVLIGGAYATGREIVEYGARFGRAGVWSILAIFAGFSLSCVLAFEFARTHRVYDYRRFVRALIGPLWPLVDVLFVVMAIIVIAVVAAASGNVAEQILGLPYAVGVGAVIVIVAVVNARGRATIEHFKTIGSFLLYGGYVLFAGVVLSRRWVELGQGLGDGSPAGAESVGTAAGAALATGVLYVGYNLATLPAAFFTVDTHTRRRHSVVAGLLSGLLATIPFVLTYLAVMSFFPDERVIAAPVPWLVMLRETAGGWLLAVFAVVMLWTLVETSVGMIHAIVDRIDGALQEGGRPTLSRGRVAVLTVGVLLLAVLLSRVGLIALVARGYTAMAYGFLLLFALPLCTVGVARILRKHREASRRITAS